MRRRIFVGKACIVAFAAIIGAGVATPAIAQSGNLHVRVMTRNMDAGTDLGYVAGVSDPMLFVQGLFQTVAEVDASNIPARADRLAAEIAETMPDLIGLQEVTIWDITVGETSYGYNQLDLLMAALKAHGLHYAVAAMQPLTDLTGGFPGGFGLPPLDVRFRDNNAILVRTDLPPGHLDILGIQQGTYLYGLSFTLPDGTPVTETNGWMAADVRIRGARFKFVNTHLTSTIPGVDDTVLLQEAQAGELLQVLAGSTLPIILAGDFNSDADATGNGPDQTPTAAIIASAGFEDAWPAVNPGDPGFTWTLGQEDGAWPYLSERIDLIFSYGAAAVSAQRTGTSVLASDHAGVVADFALQNHRPDEPVRKH